MSAVAENNGWFNNLSNTFANAASIVEMIPGGASTLRAAGWVGRIGARLIPGVGWGLMAYDAYNVASSVIDSVSAKFESDKVNGKNTTIVMDSKAINPAMAGNVAMGDAVKSYDFGNGNNIQYNVSSGGNSQFPVVINQEGGGTSNNMPDPDDDDELKKSERERKIAENRAAAKKADFETIKIEKELKEANKGWFSRNKGKTALAGLALFTAVESMFDDDKVKTPDASSETVASATQAANPYANDHNLYQYDSEYLRAAGIDGSKGIDRATLEYVKTLEEKMGEAISMAQASRGQISVEQFKQVITQIGMQELAPLNGRLGYPLTPEQELNIVKYTQTQLAVDAGLMKPQSSAPTLGIQ